MTTTAICFDLDDTLYPYDEYARAGLREAADRLVELRGRHLHNELADLYFEEGITAHIFTRLVNRHDDLSQSVTHDLVDAYHDSSVELEPYADTVGVLELLSENHRLGVLSSGRNALEKLQRLGLQGYFDTVISTERLDISKTDQESFDRLCSTLSVQPERCIYVGDDPRTDFVAPNRLDIGTVRLRRGRFSHLDPDSDVASPDVEIGRLEELPSLIEASRLD